MAAMTTTIENLIRRFWQKQAETDGARTFNKCTSAHQAVVRETLHQDEEGCAKKETPSGTDAN